MDLSAGYAATWSSYLLLLLVHGRRRAAAAVLRRNYIWYLPPCTHFLGTRVELWRPLGISFNTFI